ncbi:ferrous iron transport protein A [Methanoculleus sp. Wushi-C6]|uniref:Ferrous iron transport protein A n=1 Tax=Methanoculleus caldifontis TaxID=2651577 RepID=A0ABU3WYM3_9EURY|nr:FeoA family protein [Methanoculleus sp. Wushi-C6]MDV2480665.1 ferrous iron transport protein A [Methanoculleus sp. Wushi-C6]
MERSDATDRTPVTTLDRIGPACRCRVVAVRASGALRRRLLAMGVVSGAEVEVVRAAPFGDPTEYLVKGYHLSLRRAEASLIEVVSEGR